MSWEMEISSMDNVAVDVQLEDDERTTTCTGGLDKSSLLKDGVETSIIDALRTKMDDAKVGSTVPTIYRVPDILRNLNSNAYEPKVISLGPYHRDKPKLKSMDGFKCQFLRRFLSRNSRVGLVEYVRKVKELKDRVRDAYSEAPSCEEKEFIEMMLLDACCVLEILLYGVPAACANRWEIAFVYTDMLLLENQIPFFLLKELLRLNYPQKIDSLTAAIYEVFWDHMPGKISIPSTDLDQYHHILHLLVSCAAPEQPVPGGADQPQPSPALERKMPKKRHLAMAGQPESAMAEQPQPLPGLEQKMPIRRHLARAKQPQPVLASEWEMPIETHSSLTPESAKAEQPQPLPGLEQKMPIKTHSSLTPESAMAELPPPELAFEREVPIKTHSLLTPVSAKAEQPQPAPEPEWEMAKNRSLLTPEWSKAKQPQSAPAPVSAKAKKSPAEEKDKSSKRREPTLDWIPGARGLYESGVVFRKKEKYESFLDITFQGGIMEIPPLQIFRTIESVFRNLIAFEQCFNYAANPKSEGLHVTAYACLMDFIINTSKDVEKLDGIIVSALANDEEIAGLFNRLCVGVIFDDSSYLSGVYKSINDYCGQACHRNMATLRHNYFNNPWAWISVIAAILLFLLTITQTVLSFLAYLHPT